VPPSLFRLAAVKSSWRAVINPAGGGGSGEFGGGESRAPILNKTNE